MDLLIPNCLCSKCWPSTKKVGDKPLLSVSIFVQAVRNNVLLAIPALLYAIKNYIRFTPPPPCLLSLEGMSRWLKLDMDVASAVTLADAQCMEAAEMSRAEREHLVSVVSAPSMFVMPKISGTHCRSRLESFRIAPQVMG
ncbi:unnamed protein product [Brassica oleracea]